MTRPDLRKCALGYEVCELWASARETRHIPMNASPVARSLVTSVFPLAACRTESFHILGIVENGRFRLPWRFDLAALAPVDPANRPLSIAVHRAPGLPRPRQAGGEDEHSLQIPGHRHQTPFAAHFL